MPVGEPVLAGTNAERHYHFMVTLITPLTCSGRQLSPSGRPLFVDDITGIGTDVLVPAAADGRRG